MNKKTIVELKSEIDALKMQIYKNTVQIEDIVREIMGVKRMCENRESEIGTYG